MKKFTWQAVFRLKIKTLEKRFAAYYQAEGDSLYIIKLVVALLIRNELSETVENSQPCYDLIRKIYLTEGASLELAEYLLYFQSYFTKREWALVWRHYFPAVALGYLLIRLGQVKNLQQSRKTVMRSLFAPHHQRYSSYLLKYFFEGW